LIASRDWRGHAPLHKKHGIAGLGKEAVLARGQQADHMAFGDDDAETAQQRHQSRHRHLPLMVLGEHEAAQLRPEVTIDAGRQRRRHHVAIRRLPAFAAEIHDVRTDRQILHHEARVAFETRARRWGHGDGPLRNSLAFVSWKERKAILPAIKAIYRAENAEVALRRLEEFETEWGKRYPAIGQMWRRAWEHVVPFFAFAPSVRKMIYTTNAVEALHRSLRKIIKTRGSFPNDDAALKLLYLAIKNAGLRWRRGIAWTAAMGQFAIQFGARFPGSAS